MCFTGNPGTGKTTVALRIGELLHGPRLSCAAATWSRPRATTSSAQYVGHTAPKTKEIVGKARWAACCSSTRRTTCTARATSATTAQEAIEILLQAMEDHRDDLVVILAGYADRMATFFEANPGMRAGSRTTSTSRTSRPTSW